MSRNDSKLTCIEPGDIATVGVVVVDGDHRGDRCTAIRAERNGETGRVLDQDQLKRLPAGVDDLATTEGGRDSLKRGDRVDIAKLVCQQHSCCRRRGGGVDHGGQTALSENHGANPPGGAEPHLEAAFVVRHEQTICLSRPGRRELILEPDIGLLQLREPICDRGVDAEVGDCDSVGNPGGDPRNEGVVDVEHHAGRRLLRQLGEQLGGVVDLGETVQLVAGDVEQQRVRRLDLGGELQRVGLVELEDGDVRLEPSREPESRPASRR